MGWIEVEGRDAMGRKVPVKVELTTKVNGNGEPVLVKTEDGRTITVSTKLAEMYPERFEPVSASKAK